MGQEFLIDTNVLIYVLANFFPENREKLEHILENSFHVSIVSNVNLALDKQAFSFVEAYSW